MKINEILNENIKMPHPNELKAFDEREGIKAISPETIIRYFQTRSEFGDPRQLAQEWIKRAGHLISVFKSGGQRRMDLAYEQARQEGKQFVVVF